LNSRKIIRFHKGLPILAASSRKGRGTPKCALFARFRLLAHRNDGKNGRRVPQIVTSGIGGAFRAGLSPWGYLQLEAVLPRFAIMPVLAGQASAVSPGRLAEPIKAMIEAELSFGYRTVAWPLGFNKNTVQRIFQLKGLQARKRAFGMRPCIKAVPSVAPAPNERRSTDLARVWAGKGGWASLALVIDCHTRELLGAPVALRQGHYGQRRSGTCPDRHVRHAWPRRPGVPPEVGQRRAPSGANRWRLAGSFFTGRHFAALVRSYGLRQEFITPHSPRARTAWSSA